MSEGLTPEERVLPEYLRKLGYQHEVPVIELAKRHIRVMSNQWEIGDRGPRPVVMRSLVWKQWEGVFHYLACVEYSRHALHSLPRRAECEIEARYHSTGLVFYAQATLDLIAVWLKDQLSLSARGSDCALHKGRFVNKLTQKANEFSEPVVSRSEFFRELSEYRVHWIHRLSGGTILNKRESADSTESFVDFVVPRDPETNFFGAKSEFWERIEPDEPRGERPLYSLSEFADRFGSGTETATLSLLAAALQCSNIEETTYE